MNKQEAMTLLKKQGYKITKRREAILIFFAKEDKYHNAKNLYEYMEAEYPGISYDTVYRNLHLYHDLGILESTELQAEKHFRKIGRASCRERANNEVIALTVTKKAGSRTRTASNIG